MQHAQTNEVDAKEAPEAELEGGVDGEGRCAVHDLDDGDSECGADSRCRRPPGEVGPLRTVTRSRNRKARPSLPPTCRCGLLCLDYSEECRRLKVARARLVLAAISPTACPVVVKEAPR